MRDYVAFRKTAIRFWERRQIFYNLALIPPALVGYIFTDQINWVGDPHPMLYRFLIFWFALSAIGANIFYSFAYVLEFFFGSDRPASQWLRFGRRRAFVSGILFAMVLALIGGRNIANMAYYEQFKHTNLSMHEGQPHTL